jgi:hypothetical protein
VWLESSSKVTNGSLALEGTYNKGPLLTTTMALFGEGSFPANRVASPQAYYGMNFMVSEDDAPDPVNAGECFDMAPLRLLFANSDGTLDDGSEGNSIGADNCITNTANGGWINGPFAQSLSTYMLEWVENFMNDPERLANTFTAAGFVANQVWMMMLDQIPGWTGDASGEHESVGRLGLGAPRGIDKRRRYECYKEDMEPLSVSYRQRWRAQEEMNLVGGYCRNRSPLIQSNPPLQVSYHQDYHHSSVRPLVCIDPP